MAHTHRILALVALLALWGAPAHAAKEGDPNTITVVQPDGKKVTIEMDGADPILPGRDAPPPAPKRSPAPAPVPVQEKPIPDEIVKPKVYRDQIVAPSEERSEQPKEIAPAPVKEKAKAEKPKPKEKAKEKTKEKAKKAKPVPPRPPVQKDVQRNVAPGAEITERMASSIAFDAAPPSSGFTTMRQSYKGKDVYVVTFKTEEGPYDVLVDVLTGDVVVSGYVENAPEGGTPAPGHLPSDWEPFKPVPVGQPAKN